MNKPSPDMLVVNVGDSFQVWSYERVKSVMHRALVKSLLRHWSTITVPCNTRRL
ncbi:hypothetical protein KC19_7G108300 [Ceratodon purpureus]|uniref:Isopenicillin N synthase-like Fe(2+) 2OG dioxygenase domain-containing protein n=1 Tax=Ceratodon purpureus TaxID=3225 RepID=A0A8T0HDC0_CERPU|nr:hypothetical protein KC19_7G108300 [Ceratodon purpureus]